MTTATAGPTPRGRSRPCRTTGRTTPAPRVRLGGLLLGLTLGLTLGPPDAPGPGWGGLAWAASSSGPSSSGQPHSGALSAGPFSAGSGATLSGTRQPAAIAARPQVLSDTDARRYRQIFALQDEGNWAAADTLIAALADPILMGHVTAQRLLHPTAYRASGAELADWLRRYADHPQAERIHALAKRRTREPLPAPVDDEDTATWDSLAAPAEGRGWRLAGSYGAQAGAAQRHWGRFRAALHAGQTLVVKRLIADPATHHLSPLDQDRMKAGLAYAYFIDGEDAQALEWAQQAIHRSGTRVPLAHWAAGLAHWRAGAMDQAAPHFEAVAKAPDTSAWLQAAGAYWAARTALRARHPERATPWLEAAAASGQTFYGLIARRALGRPLPFDWASPRAPAGEARGSADAALAADPRGRRALALIQIDQIDRATQDLTALHAGAPPPLRRRILAAAADHGLPHLALRLSLRDRAAGDEARYPLLPWAPRDGWRVDPALVHAFVRQESAFDPTAGSRAGARGLMQLMPRTAAHVAGDRSLARPDRRADLLDPETNLTLGQAYLADLLRHPRIRGNLFAAAAAYNAGPGRLMGWLTDTAFADDPLLFVESIDSRETRIFIERVLTNYWAYRARLGRPQPSLDAVAAGDWPREPPPVVALRPSAPPTPPASSQTAGSGAGWGGVQTAARPDPGSDR